MKVLNEGVVVKKEHESVDISSKLQKLMLQMKGQFMSDEGNVVDYTELATSDLFLAYVEQTRQLQNVDVGLMTDEQKMAFFINIYNALTIHGICTEDIPKSVLQVKQFWRNIAYNIGGLVYSLDDIEHGILRGNRPHPSNPKPLLDEKDARLKYSIEKVDPRIHFALVCGAKSCPAINVYSSKNLEQGLQAAAVNFCSQEVHVDLKERKVEISKLFSWYSVDFGKTNDEVLRSILSFLSGDAFQNLEKLLNDSENNAWDSNINVIYSEYNWNLNSVKTGIKH